jgi:hypothetical protein
MQIHYLGVAVGLAKNGGVGGNRSMMIHPSKETMQHASYVHWARQIRHHWDGTLALDPHDPDRRDLVDAFRKAYGQLEITAQDTPPFDELLPFLPGAIKATNIIEVNRAKGPTPQVDWQQIYAHILVGGEVLNRGFTVEGLTVTYMPRSRGVGNADTIEQRARWFGYKADYLGYCRVYLSDQTRRAYESYVRHEENIRQQLGEHRAKGRSLREWRRAFFLSPDLRPTRADVLDLDYMRGNFSNTWFQPSAPHYSDEATVFNRNLIQGLKDTLAFLPDAGHPKRTNHQKHLIATNVGLRRVFDELLTKFRAASPGDSQRFTGLLLQIAARLENTPDDTCSIYLVSSGATRDRRVNDEDEIAKLFEGAYPDEPEERVGEIYPGDSHIRASSGLTIQIHTLNITKGTGAARQVLAQEVPALAVWVPREMAAAWVVQDQDHPQK